MTSKEIICDLINYMESVSDTYDFTHISKEDCKQILKDLDRLEKLEKVIKEVIIRNNASIKFLQVISITKEEKEEAEKIIAFLDAVTKTLKEVFRDEFHKTSTEQ